MSFSMTGLERGDAEDICALLVAYNGDMTDIIGGLQRIANILDNHAEDTVTSGLVRSFDIFFKSIRDSMDNIVEITKTSICELEKKNEVLCNKYLEEDIDSLRAAIDKFLNGIVFNSDLLNGSDTVKDEELSEIGYGLSELVMDWTDIFATNKRRAEDKAEAYVQNEMSQIFRIIMESLNTLMDATEQLIADIIHQNFNIEDAYNERSGKMQSFAEESAERSSRTIKSKMEQVVDDFASIDFFGGI